MGFADFVATTTSNMQKPTYAMNYVYLSTTFTKHIRRALENEKNLLLLTSLPPNRPSQLFQSVIDLLSQFKIHGCIKVKLQVAVGYRTLTFFFYKIKYIIFSLKGGGWQKKTNEFSRHEKNWILRINLIRKINSIR